MPHRWVARSYLTRSETMELYHLRCGAMIVIYYHEKSYAVLDYWRSTKLKGGIGDLALPPITSRNL